MYLDNELDEQNKFGAQKISARWRAQNYDRDRSTALASGEILGRIKKVLSDRSGSGG